MEAGVTVYAGYPNRITTDQGSLFTSKYWDDIVALHRIDLELFGIESQNSIDIGKGYHVPLWHTFKIIRNRCQSVMHNVVLR